MGTGKGPRVLLQRRRQRERGEEQAAIRREGRGIGRWQSRLLYWAVPYLLPVAANISHGQPSSR